MASTVIDITLKGVDKASSVIKGVADKLNGLGGGGAGGGGGFAKLLSGGVKMATQSLKQMGGALSSLGPAGMAAGLVVAAAMKRMAYEAEQNVNAIKDQEQALQAMADAANKVNERLEARLRMEQRLREIRDDIDDADPIRRAETSLTNVKAEIEAVQRQIEEMDGVRRVALRMANEHTGAVENVRAGHLVWWETGTEKTNAENIKAAEEARKRAAQAMEKQLALQQRLTILKQEQEKAEKGIRDAQDKTTQAADEVVRKAAEERDKASRKDRIKGLQAEQKALMEQLASYKQLSSPLRLSGLYQAGSHSSALLLDRLAGKGRDTTSMEISKNVKSISDRLGEIATQLEQMQTV
jgi:hypothetical protein